MGANVSIDMIYKINPARILFVNYPDSVNTISPPLPRWLSAALVDHQLPAHVNK